MIGFVAGVHQSHDNSHMIGSVEVHPDHRRKGVATRLYNAIENRTKKKLKPSPMVSSDAQAFWKNRLSENEPTTPKTDWTRVNKAAAEFLAGKRKAFQVCVW